jgi:hypothetical protein
VPALRDRGEKPPQLGHWFERYPKAAYLTQVESWRLTDDGLVEFTMRRLPTAD